MSEKTEQPTPKRLRDARRRGQFARSRLLSSAVVSAGALGGLFGFAPESAARLKTWTASVLSRQDVAADAALMEALQLLAWMAAPAVVGAFLASAAVSMVMAGFHFHPQELAPKLERIDPAAGFKRLFSTRQLFEVVRGFLVTIVIAYLVWDAVSDAAPAVLRAVRADAAFDEVLRRAGPLLGKCLAVVVVLGVADYALARRRHLKDLMMSREEVKEEHKSSEGDPHHKAKRKALHRQLAMGGPARGLKKATCVVVNPTHIAVALRYDESEADAPYIVAKGREEDALKIRREAKALGIPVVKDVPLARSLVHYDVGEQIPEELYQAAAAVLKVAFEQRQVQAGNGQS